MIRLKDVAARAGVSLMTVSKVLRDAPDVSQATKTRIRRLAVEMGYVPDASAQGLRTRKTHLFGVVIPSLAHPVCCLSALAIEERCSELGYDVLLAQTRDDPQREENAIRRLLARRVDGLFLHPVYRLSPRAPIYEELFNSKTPTIILGHRSAFCEPFVSVAADDLEASYQLTNHLLRLGHTRIAFLAGRPANPWAQERFEGYERALRDAGLPTDERLVFSAGSSFDDGRQAARQLVGEGTCATALQAVTDPVARGAALTLFQHGLRIPEDISIAGFGDYPTNEPFHVPLTTVCEPKLSIGTFALEGMLRLLRGEQPESRRLEGELVIRGSTAAPTRTAPLLEIPRSMHA